MDETQNALFEMPAAAAASESAVYRVLARKYRPQTFSELKGQDALVRTLTNAFATGRVAHAFMLTGVRGVGKTTTARIIAKGLNCVQGATISPCGVCEACVSISEGRNVDVLEMDAASRTGVDDIREIIEGVRYAPTSVRTKVYIIDEVHMLSKNAFNALLKTLEEPPPHVKFIFATTEIRKVPITVLSRCQRFDLRRIEADVLAQHFAEVAKTEGVEIDAEALRLIARAADGSARDGMSLLDQAIARSGTMVTGEMVRDMLGLADRGATLDLLMLTLQGNAAGALSQLEVLRRGGADALIMLQDLLDCTHQMARLKVLPEGQDQSLTEGEQKRLSELASSLATPVLARAWQVLLKGLPEVQAAPMPIAALEMLLIRLSHIGTLPPPGDLIKRLDNAPHLAGAVAASHAPQGGGSGAPVLRLTASGGGHAHTHAVAQHALSPLPQTWRQAVALFADNREMLLYAELSKLVECHSFSMDHIEIFPRAGTSPTIVGKLGSCLQRFTGKRVMVSVAQSSQHPTLAEEDDKAAVDYLQSVAQHPVVKAVLLAFPQAKLAAVHDRAAEIIDITPSLAEVDTLSDDTLTLMSDEE